MIEEKLTMRAVDPDFFRDDRMFFLRNKHRSFRLRPITEAETAEFNRFSKGYANFVIVQQLAPGIRIRTPIIIYGELLATMPPLRTITDKDCSRLLDIVRTGRFSSPV